MARLIRSLQQAEYASDASVTVDFALDGTGNKTLDGEMDAAVQSLVSAWPHGSVSWHRRRTRAGLRDNVLGAWHPTSDDSPPAVFLEDDIEVSPLWHRWLQAGLRMYHTELREAEREQLIGISLYTPDDMNEAYKNAMKACVWQDLHARSRSPHAASAVLFGQPCSWGALFFARSWRGFLQQAVTLRALGSDRLPHVPCPAAAAISSSSSSSSTSLPSPPSAPPCRDVVVNRWGTSSWKRLLTLHMVAHGQYMLYPNMPRRHSFSTNHVEQGVHVRSEAVIQVQRRRHRVPLVTSKFCDSVGMACDDPSGDDDGRRAFELPWPATLWDFYCQPQPDDADDGMAAMRDAGAVLLAKLPPPAEEVDAATRELRAEGTYEHQGGEPPPGFREEL